MRRATAGRRGATDWRLAVAFVGGVLFAVVVGAGFPGLQPTVDGAEGDGSGPGPMAVDPTGEGPAAALGGLGRALGPTVGPATTGARDDLAQGWAPASEAIDRDLQANLTARVEQALAEVGPKSAGAARGSECTVSFLVADIATGRIVASREPDRSLAPASNLKLFTTLAALQILGPSWSFRTVVEAAGELRGGRLAGDLVVRAGGDPLYRHDDPHYAAERLASLAFDLRAAGLTAVDGDLVLDLATFPELGPAPGWPSSSASWTGSYGYVAGLTANGGLVDLSFEALAGGRTRSSAAPHPNGLREEHGVRSGSRSINDVRIGLFDSSARLTLSGELGPPGRTYERDIRHPDPPAMFASLFRAALVEAGIEVRGSTRRERRASGGTVLAELTTPWVDLLVPINRHSVNSVADAVFLALGGATSGVWTRDAARAAVVDALVGLDVAPDGLWQVGGSGLSRDNRVSARMVVELLRAALSQERAVRELFIDSLAVAGRTGTLESRMRGGAAEGRLRGKTGFIQGASALAGVVDTRAGSPLVFSILVEYPRLGGLNNSIWKPMHDALGERLAEWGG